MIRVEYSFLETSYSIFRHPDSHRIGYWSCIHLGRAAYFKKLQHAIDAWAGIIFEEFLTGDERLGGLIPREKAGVQVEWAKFHKLQGMKSQRRILKYPISRTISADISWLECVKLFDTISLRLPFPDKYLKRVVLALESNPREACRVLWFMFIACLKAYGDLPEVASYREEITVQENSFRPIREHIESLPGATPHLLKLYKVIEHIYLHEPTTSFVPERDTAVLRGIDFERCGQKRDILLVYGGGHYRGIARGLYDRGYTKVEGTWMKVCNFPTISLRQFTEALIAISKSI